MHTHTWACTCTHNCMYACTHPHADVAPRQVNLMCSVYTVPGPSVSSSWSPPSTVCLHVRRNAIYIVSRFGLVVIGVRLVSRRTLVWYHFGSPFSSKRLWFEDTVLWLCPSLPTETLKWLSSLLILMQKSFWWWQCSNRYIILISRTVSVYVNRSAAQDPQDVDEPTRVSHGVMCKWTPQESVQACGPLAAEPCHQPVQQHQGHHSHAAYATAMKPGLGTIQEWGEACHHAHH